MIYYRKISPALLAKKICKVALKNKLVHIVFVGETLNSGVSMGGGFYVFSSHAKAGENGFNLWLILIIIWYIEIRTESGRNKKAQVVQKLCGFENDCGGNTCASGEIRFHFCVTKYPLTGS